jgi:hypothetical protein
LLVACSARKAPPPPAAKLLGDRPTLLGPLATLPPRETPLGEARRLAPAFFDEDDQPREVTAPEYPGLRFSCSVRSATHKGSRVGAPNLVFRAEEAVPTLTAAWGPPGKSVDGDDRIYLWLNREGRLRALLALGPDDEQAYVEIEAYTPLEEMLAAGPLFGFEKRSLLGRTTKELEAELGRPLDFDIPSLEIAPTEWETGIAEIVLRVDDDRVVTSFEFWLPYGDDASREHARRLVEQKLGTPRLVEENLIFDAGDRRIEVHDEPRSHAWQVVVTRR